MTARATRALDGPLGNWLPGQTILGVPDETVASWVEAGVAEYLPEAVAAPGGTVASSPTTEAGDELDSLKINDLRAKAKELGVSAGGSADAIRARIREATPPPPVAETPADDEPSDLAAAIAAYSDEQLDEAIATYSLEVAEPGDHDAKVAAVLAYAESVDEDDDGDGDDD